MTAKPSKGEELGILGRSGWLLVTVLGRTPKGFRFYVINGCWHGTFNEETQTVKCTAQGHQNSFPATVACRGTFPERSWDEYNEKIAYMESEYSIRSETSNVYPVSERDNAIRASKEDT